MPTLIIWWAGIALESLVILRAIRGRHLIKYPFFYTYVASVLFWDVLLYVIYVTAPSLYPGWSRNSELLNIILGYGIILEIFKHVLSPYPGAERFSRIAGLIVIAVVFCIAIIYPFMMPGGIPGPATKAEIERDFFTVQAIFLFSILGVVFRYGIAIGRNLKGMIFGYSLCLGTTLMVLALRSYIGSSFDAAWIFIQPFSYLISLLIWVVALWSYFPNPLPDSSIHLEEDYEAFVARTRDMMGAMRSHLAKASRL